MQSLPDTVVFTWLMVMQTVRLISSSQERPSVTNTRCSILFYHSSLVANRDTSSLFVYSAIVEAFISHSLNFDNGFKVQSSKCNMIYSLSSRFGFRKEQTVSQLPLQTEATPDLYRGRESAANLSLTRFFTFYYFFVSRNKKKHFSMFSINKSSY